MSIPPSSAPGPDHTIRHVTMTTGSGLPLSPERNSTIGKSMAKVKAFMEGSGDENIKGFGQAIKNDYAFSLFPQAREGFLLEINGKSVHVTFANPNTQTIANEVQKIWNQINGATVEGTISDSRASPRSELTPSSSRPSSSTNPRAATPESSSPEVEEDTRSPASSRSPPKTRNISVDGPRSRHSRRDSTGSVASSSSAYHSIQDLEPDLEREISERTLDNKAAIIAFTDGSIQSKASLKTILEGLLDEGERVLQGPLGSNPRFTDTTLQVLEGNYPNEFCHLKLDLALLEDLLICLNTKRFKDAAVTLTLLSRPTQDLLIRNLGLQDQIRKSIDLPSRDDEINDIAASLKQTALTKPSCLVDVERTKNTLSFLMYQEATLILESDRVNRYEEAIADLRDKNSDLKRTCHRYRLERDEARADLSVVYNELHRQQQELEQTAALCYRQADEFTRARSALEDQLAASSHQINALTQQAAQDKAQAETDLAALRAENTSLKDRYTEAVKVGEELKALIEQKQAELETSQEATAQLDARMANLTRTVDASLQELAQEGGDAAEGLAGGADITVEDKLRILLAALKAKIQQGDETASRQQQEALRLTAQLTTLCGERDTLNQNQRALQTELREAQDSQRGLEARIALLTAEKDAALAKTQRVEEELAEAGAKILSLEAVVDQQSSTIAELTDAIAAKQDELTQKEADLARITQELAEARENLQAQGQAFNKELQEVTGKLTASQEKLSTLQTEHAQLQQAHQSQRRELDQLNQTLTSITQEKLQLEQALRDLTSELAQAQKEKEDLTAQLGQKDAALREALAGLQNLETLKKQAVGMITQQRDQIEALTTHNDRLQTRIEANEHSIRQAYKKADEEAARFDAVLNSLKDQATGELTALNERIDRATQTIHSLREALARETGDKAKIQALLDEEINKAAGLSDDLQAAGQAYEQASKDLQAKESENASLKEQLASLQTAQARLIAQHEAQLHEITSLHDARIQEAEASFKDRLEELARSQNEAVANLARQLQDKDAIIDNKQQIIDDQNAAFLGIARRLGINDQNIQALPRAIENKFLALDSRKIELEQHAQQLQDELRVKEQALQAAQASFSEIEQTFHEQISSLSAENQTQARELEEQLGIIASLQDHLSQKTQECSALSSSKEALKQALIEAQAKEAKSQATILQNEAKIQALDDLIASQTQKQLETQEQLDAVLKEKATITQALQDALSQVKDQDTQLAEQVEQITHLQQDLSAKEAVITRMRDDFKAQIQALKEEKTTLQQAIGELKASFERDLDASLRALSKLEASSKEQTDALQNAHEATSQQLQIAQSKLQDLEIKAAELSRLQTALTPELTTPEAIRAHLARFEKLQHLAAEFAANLMPMGETPTQIKEFIDTIQEKNGSLTTSLEEKTAQIQELQDRLEKALSDKQNLEAQLSAQSGAHASALEENKAQIQRLEETLKNLEASTKEQIESLRQAHAQLSKQFLEENKRLQEELALKGQQLDMLEPQAAELARLQKALAPDNLLTPEAIQEHLARFRELQTLQKSFTDELSSIGATPTNIKNHIQAQETAVTSLAADLENKSQECDRLQARITELEKALAAREQTLQDTQKAHAAQITSLKEEHFKATQNYSDNVRQLTETLSNQEAVASQTIAALQAANDEHVRQIDRLYAITEAQTRDLAGLTDTREAIRSENTSLKTALQKSQKTTALTKLQALIAKKELLAKAKAFSSLQLHRLSQKQAEEKKQLEDQITSQKALFETLQSDHDSLIAFLKQQLKPGEHLNPAKTPLEALKEVFAARLKAQEQTNLAIGQQLAKAQSNLATQSEALAQANARIATFEAQEAAAKAKILTLEQAQASIKKEKHQLEASLAEIASSSIQEAEAIEALRKQLVEATTTQIIFASEKARLHQDNQRLSLERDQAKKDALSQKTSLDALTRSHETLEKAHKDQSSALRATQANYDEVVLALAQERKQQTKALEDLKRRHDLALSEIGQELSEAKRLILSKEEALKTSKKELTQLEADHQQELARLEARYQETKAATTAQQQAHQAELASLKQAQSSSLTLNQTQIRAQEQELTSLKEKLTSLEALQRTHLAQIAQDSAKIASLTETNSALESAKGDLEKNLAAVKAELASKLVLLASQKAHAEAAIASLGQEKDALKAQLDSLSSQNTLQSQELSSTIQELQEKHTNIAALQAGLAAALAEKEEAQKNLLKLSSTSRERTLALEETISSLQEELRAEKQAANAIAIANQGHLTALLQHLTSLQATIPAVGPVLESIKQKASAADGPIAISDIVSFLEPLSEKVLSHISDLESRHTQKEALQEQHIASLQKDLAGLQQEQADLKAVLTRSDASIRSLEERLKAQETSFQAALDSKIAELQALRASSDKKDSDFIDQIARLTAQNQDASKEITSLKQNNETLGARVQELIAQNKEQKHAYDATLNKVQEELAEARALNQALQHTYQEQLHAIEQKQGQIHQLERELISAKAHNADLSGELEALKQKHAQDLERYKSIEQELARASQTTDRSSSQIQALLKRQEDAQREITSQQEQIAEITALNLSLAEAKLQAQQAQASAQQELEALKAQLSQSEKKLQNLHIFYQESEKALKDQHELFRGLQEAYSLLEARNSELEARQEAALSATPAALAAQKRSYEQLIASLEMARVITQEALPTTDYGRFDRLYHNNTAAIVTALKNPDDLNLRIQYALSAPPEDLKHSCENALIILSMPFADDTSFATGRLDNLVHVSIDPRAPVTFPPTARLALDQTTRAKIEAGGTRQRAGVAAAASSNQIATLYSACCQQIQEQLAKHSKSLKPPAKSTPAHASASSVDPSSALFNLSTQLVRDVNTLLRPETSGGRYGRENLFNTFMPQQEIKTYLINYEAQIPVLIDAREKAQKELSEAHKRLSAIRGEIGPSSTGTSITSITSSRATEAALEQFSAQSIYNKALYNAKRIDEELTAFQAFQALSEKHEVSTIFTALTQAFANGASYFEESEEQTRIEAIVTYFTHIHLDKLLDLIIHNPSLAKDLCVYRILVGTQMIGHSYKEMHELKDALKSAFTLLKQLYTAVYSRL